MIIPVEITVYEDKSFTFILKAAGLPAAEAVRARVGICKGAADPQGSSSGHPQLEEIAKIKMPDLNCVKVESAMKVVSGTAANMGIKIDGCGPRSRAPRLAWFRALRLSVDERREYYLQPSASAAHRGSRVERYFYTIDRGSREVAICVRLVSSRFSQTLRRESKSLESRARRRVGGAAE